MDTVPAAGSPGPHITPALVDAHTSNPALLVPLADFCRNHGACRAGRDWALANCQSVMEAFRKAPDHNWRLWIATRPDVLSTDQLRRFAVFCARQVIHLNPDPRVLACIETMERFLSGLATRAELCEARRSADAADAADAAYAAYAAYAAAAYAADAAYAAAADAAYAAAAYAAYAARRSSQGFDPGSAGRSAADAVRADQTTWLASALNDRTPGAFP